MRKLLGLIGLMGLMGFLPVQPIKPILPIPSLHAQDTAISLRVEGLAFFVDNEYSGSLTDGYTLPGFVLRPHVDWRLDRRVTLQLGANWLHYWGNHGFLRGPVNGVVPMASDTVSTLHIVPWLQACIDFTPELSLVLGSLVNTDGHGLPLPLYNQERIFATDPEAGAQLLADWRWLKADVWVDWRDFIWYGSPRQEVFNCGAALTPRLPLGSGFVLTMPLHALVQHHGGEGLADTTMGHNNRFNGSAGLGLDYRNGELHLAARCQGMLYTRSGEEEGTLVYDDWGCLISKPVNFKHGWGALATAEAEYGRAHADVSYWTGEKFIPLLGSYHFSNLSENTPDMTHDRTRVVTLRGCYTWTFRDCRLMLTGAYYHYFPCTGDRTDYWKCQIPAENMFSFGLLLHFNPTIRLL